MLAVTIIVLLILSGVTITVISGDNGIISKSQTMSNLSKRSQIITDIGIDILASELTEELTEDKFEEILSQYGTVQYDSDGKITGLLPADLNEIIDIEDIYTGDFATKWAYDSEGKITNGTVTLAIGDYVDYSAGSYTYTSSASMNGYCDQVFNTSTYTYGWRVLGVDENTGKLLIISEDLIGPDSGGYTDSTYNRTYYYLSGQTGYANCVTELDKICEIYGNGVGATGARCMTAEDINKITGYNPNNVGVYDPEQTGSGVKYSANTTYEYGNEVTYYWQGEESPYYSTSNGKTGSLSSHSSTFYWWTGTAWTSSTLSSTSSGTNMEKITTLTSNDYYYYPTTLTTSSSGTTVGIETTSTEYYMLFTNSSNGAYPDGANDSSGYTYWLNSRACCTNVGMVGYGLEGVASGYMGLYYLARSTGKTEDKYLALRPVVFLSTTVSLSYSNGTWQISQ